MIDVESNLRFLKTLIREIDIKDDRRAMLGSLNLAESIIEDLKTELEKGLNCDRTC